MKTIAGFLLTVFAFTSGPSTAQDETVVNDVRIINAQVIEKLGISLPALAYLIEFGAMGALLPECLAKATGKYRFIEELVDAGYINLSARDVPKELQTTNQGRFIKVKTTQKGAAILNSLSVMNNETLLSTVQNHSCK